MTYHGIVMSDHGKSERWGSPGEERPEPERPDGVDTVERYDVDGGIVFYDPENPLAWVEATRSIHLSEIQ
jgi:hypothetical protein